MFDANCDDSSQQCQILVKTEYSIYTYLHDHLVAIMEKIPDQLGYLILTEDGAVLESGGELENDERVATIITDLLSLSHSVDPVAFGPEEQFKKISITYDDHWFAICISNKKIYVVKRKIEASASEGISVNV